MRIRKMTTGDLAAVTSFLAGLERSSGVPPLGESKYVDLRGPRHGIGLIGGEGTIVAYVHLLWHPAQAIWEMELAADAETVETSAVEAMVEAAAAVASARLLWWTFGTTGGAAVAADTFREARRLHKLVGSLPLGGPGGVPPGVRIAPFRPGVDEDAWLTVNNAAFAGHPENGSWERADILERQSRGWFDAEGFRLAWLGERLAGFCWTKLHRPQLGEIHVVAVHPDFRRRGLGRVIVIEALGYLADRGCTRAMLYVDTANGSALELYQSLGFELERVDRCFEVPNAWPHDVQ